MYSVGSHHIPDDNGFSPYKKSHQRYSGDQSLLSGCFDGSKERTKILSMKNTVNSQCKYNYQKNAIKNNFFLTLHFLSFQQFQDPGFDPVADFCICTIQSGLFADHKTYSSKQHSSSHVHKDMLFRQQCGDKYQHCNSK